MTERDFPYQELDIGVEWPLLPDGEPLVPRFVAYEYPSDHAARIAWEKANRKAKEVSCSRLSGRGKPPKPPFAVIAVGERMERLRQVNRLLTSVHGAKLFPLSPDMARALAMRRYRLAVDAVEKGAPSLKQVHRYGMEGRPMRLDDDGNMTPDERRGL